MIEINDQLVALNNDFEIDPPSILSTCGNRIYKCGSFIANVLRFIKRNLRIFYFFLKVYNFFLGLLNSIWFYFFVSFLLVLSYYIGQCLVKVALFFLGLLKNLLIQIYNFFNKKKTPNNLESFSSQVVNQAEPLNANISQRRINNQSNPYQFY